MESPPAAREEAEVLAAPDRPSCPPSPLGWPLPPPAAIPLPARVQEDARGRGRRCPRPRRRPARCRCRRGPCRPQG
eukprot:12378959-Alexandrium_andersonii.AAC.1